MERHRVTWKVTQGCKRGMYTPSEWYGKYNEHSGLEWGGRLHGVGAPSLGPWSYWTWIGYGRVKVRTSWVQRQEQRVAWEEPEKRRERWSVALSLWGRLNSPGRRERYKGRKLTFMSPSYQLMYKFNSPRNKVLEDKESTYSQETIFASISDRIHSENADFTSGLTGGNILDTNTSWWEREGTEKVGKVVLGWWTPKWVHSQQMSDSYVFLLSKAGVCTFVCTFGGSHREAQTQTSPSITPGIPLTSTNQHLSPGEMGTHNCEVCGSLCAVCIASAFSLRMALKSYVMDR